MAHKKVPLKSKFGYLVVVAILLVGWIGYSFMGNGSGRRGGSVAPDNRTSVMKDVLPKAPEVANTEPAPPGMDRPARRSFEPTAEDQLPPAEPAKLHGPAGPRVVTVTAAEHPDERLKKLPPLPSRLVKPADNEVMDPASPPRWTSTLAAPAAPSQAPNPLNQPAMKVDPRRN